MTACVVVPNHLPHLDFLEEWTELRGVPIIVVQDSSDYPQAPPGFMVSVYNHSFIDKALKTDSWIIPRRTSAVRSYGYLVAWRAGYDTILTLDNDCYPEQPDYWLKGHQANLASSATLGWVSGCDLAFTRGFPYRIRKQNPVMLSHGVWSNVPDLDAATSLHAPTFRTPPATQTAVMPRGNYFPMCGMNLAWHRDITPLLYFGLFGPEYGFDQYDDIWAGVLAKKVLDHLGYACVTGYPSVDHRKQSDVYANLRKQAPGLEMNENFWLAVDRINLTEKTVRGAYVELIDRLPDVIEGEPDGWTAKFKQAALIWAGLFQ